jgi:hypothetical protein
MIMNNCMINLQHMQTNRENGAPVYVLSAHDGAFQLRIVRLLGVQSVILQRYKQEIIPLANTNGKAAHAALWQELTSVVAGEQRQR